MRAGGQQGGPAARAASGGQCVGGQVVSWGGQVVSWREQVVSWGGCRVSGVG